MEQPRFTIQLCELEPVHTPGTIQPHGLLLVLNDDYQMIQVSENCQTILGIAPDALLKQPLVNLIGPIQWQQLRKKMRLVPPFPPFPLQLELLTTLEAPSSVLQKAANIEDIAVFPLAEISKGRRIRLFDGVVYQHNAHWIIELEPAFLYESCLHDEALYQFSLAERRIQTADNINDLCYATAQQLQRLSGFSRVMVYRFGEDWHGEIIAEVSTDKSVSYLGLHFPASDIPAQVRQLYTLNKVRLIVDCEGVSVPLYPALNPDTELPLDLTYAILRGVSPIHREYLQNMQVRAAFSASILIDGYLWGLVVAHHPLPKRLSYATRASCECLVNQLTLQLQFQQQLAHTHERQRIAEIVNQMIQGISVVRDSLTILQDNRLLYLFSADGAYVSLGDRQVTLGTVPASDELQSLHEWLHEQSSDSLYYTHHLKAFYPVSDALQICASGVLYIPLLNQSAEFIILFRAERIKTVNWAGNPDKFILQTESDKISPRKSFELWQQEVYGQSAPWTDEELEAADELRMLLLDKLNSNRVYNLIEQRVEERTAELHTMNEDLKNFAYIVSHDMRAPLINIKGFTEELRYTLDETYQQLETALGQLPASHRQTIELEMTVNMPEAMDYIDVSVNKMEQLISATAKLSRLGHKELVFEPLNTQALVAECLKSFAHRLEHQQVTVTVEPLPEILADRLSIQQIFSNLIDNALKYMAPNRSGHIVISAYQQPNHTFFQVQDNGRGIAEKEVSKVFQMFQRAGEQNQPGEGMGLSFVQTLVHRHGGQISCESELDKGTIFTFSLSRANDIIFV